MGFVQSFVIVFTFSSQLVLTFPLTEPAHDHTEERRECTFCPAGEFQKSCTECQPCPAGSYTNQRNQEERCHRCFGDCRPEFHLKILENCTNKSDVKCVCEEGFTCNDLVSYSANCRYCKKIQETTVSEAAAVILVKDKQMLSSSSSGQKSTSAKHCGFHRCDHQSIFAAGNGTHLKRDETSAQLVAIFCPVVVVGCVTLLILYSVLHRRNESCFKQAISLLVCNRGGREAPDRSKESAQGFPRDPFIAKPPQSTHSAANPGLVHVHNPGTVIFSLISEFSGQICPTVQSGTTKERGRSEEEDEGDSPVLHPTSSPSLNLSEEEQSTAEAIFFPSQEQGKDCHLSKEEVLRGAL